MDTTLSRRSFIRGAISLIAVAASSKYTFAKPRIWGDGVHDDAPGLNAMFAGEDFVTSTDFIRDADVTGSAQINGGEFLLRSPLNLTKGGIIRNCCLLGRFDKADQAMIRILSPLEGVRFEISSVTAIGPYFEGEPDSRAMTFYPHPKQVLT